MNACTCAAPVSWVWPALFAALAFVGAAAAALAPPSRRALTGPEAEEIRALRRALVVEVLQRRRVVAMAREWLPAPELAHALTVDPADVEDGAR